MEKKKLTMSVADFFLDTSGGRDPSVITGKVSLDDLLPSIVIIVENYLSNTKDNPDLCSDLEECVFHLKQLPPNGPRVIVMFSYELGSVLLEVFHVTDFSGLKYRKLASLSYIPHELSRLLLDHFQSLNIGLSTYEDDDPIFVYALTHIKEYLDSYDEPF